MFEPAEKVRKFFKVALWGDKKSGKTRFGLSFPKPCVIDTERGTVLFADRFKFDVKDANHWKELGDVLSFLEKNPGKYETLVIDSVTVFWKDLIDEVTQTAVNKTGLEVLQHYHWGIIKRRWTGFLNKLIDLDMNVVLVIREKDEYKDELDPQTGKTVSKKTGDHLADAEKSTLYTFDFILQMKAEVDKKKKTAKYLAVVDGSRRDELPRFKEFDITDQNGYETIFRPIEKAVMSGKTSSVKLAKQEPSDGNPIPPLTPEKTEKIKLPPPMTDKEKLAEIRAMAAKFAGAGNGPQATGEDIKVLMTRASQLTWPDGRPFKSEDGKKMLKEIFCVEKSTDLKKCEANFLYDEMGEVLAGRAKLVLEAGVPLIERASWNGE